MYNTSVEVEIYSFKKIQRRVSHSEKMPSSDSEPHTYKLKTISLSYHIYHSREDVIEAERRERIADVMKRKGITVRI